MVGFYKHDIPAWMDGTEDLSDGAYRAYHVIIQLIMLNEGPIALNERGLAGRCNQAIKSFRVHLDALLKAGKLSLLDGRLSNARADLELQAVMKNRANASIGGSSGKKSPQKSYDQPMKGASPSHEPPINGASPPHDSAINAANPLKNNETSEAPLEKSSSLKEKRREEKTTPIVPNGDEVAFQEFKAAYPARNVRFSTAPTRKRYIEAIKRGATPAALLAAAKSYAAEMRRAGNTGERAQFVKTAEVWLNQDLWRDHVGQDRSTLGGGSTSADYLARLSDDRWRDAVRHWKKTLGQWDLARHTPPPDEPGTKVPKHILTEFAIVERAPASRLGHLAVAV